MTDQELVEACLKKNSSAQKELYDRFAGKMMGVCLRYSQGQDDAQDILQDGFNWHRFSSTTSKLY